MTPLFEDEIPDDMTQPALADAIPTLVEFVSTHPWEAGIEYRRGIWKHPCLHRHTTQKGGK
jgi:hypothetical protein